MSLNVELDSGASGPEVRTRLLENGEDLEDVPTVEDITTQITDPEQFDRTYAALARDFTVGGEVSSPTPFPLQAIPRLAFVINYNVLYNPDRDRWEPQKKGDLGLLDAVLDDGALVEDDVLELDFTSNIAATTSGSDPATVEVSATAGQTLDDFEAVSAQTVDSLIKNGPIGSDRFPGHSLLPEFVDTWDTFPAGSLIPSFSGGQYDFNGIPSGLDTDPFGLNLVAVDIDNDLVRELSKSGGVIQDYFAFTDAEDIAVDPLDGTFWIIDDTDVFHFERDGDQLAQVTDPTGSTNGPDYQGITIDASDGNIWVTDDADDQFVELDRSFTVLQSHNTEDGSGFQVDCGALTWFPEDGTLWIKDRFNDRYVAHNQTGGTAYRNAHNFDTQTGFGFDVIDGNIWEAVESATGRQYVQVTSRGPQYVADPLNRHYAFPQR